MHRAATRLCAAAASLAAVSPAFAGPPYVSDDPQPTEAGRSETYVFVAGAHTPGVTTGAAGLDLNFGPVEDVQLTAVLPVEFQTGQPSGPGDIELAAKYKVLHQGQGHFGLDVAVFPRVFLPTGGRRYGTGRTSLLLPVWAEKDFGPWSVFGGGGFTINPGPDQRNNWLAGLAVTRQVTPRLNLGAEVYHQTPDARDSRDFTGINLGIVYRATDHWSILASGGPGVQNAGREGQYGFYVSLKADY